jgi:tRNA pseudouridine13 synthase
MKLRRLPEDFQVEELTAVAPGKDAAGPHALYRLTKRSLGTPEALDVVLRRWKLTRDKVAFGGLKDRHAVTRQYVTIFHGPRRGMRQDNLELEYLGQTAEPFHAKDIAGNRFDIVVRELTTDEVRAAEAALEHVKREGVPNYFDDQRFGSLGESGEFIARAWCLGDYERAVWLALAEPNEHDLPKEREQKRRLREQWGRWKECQAALAKSHRKTVVMYLVQHPTNFRGALARLRVDLRGLYLAAYQSYLWNRLLAAVLRQECRAGQLVALNVAGLALPFHHDLDEAQLQRLREMTLPLPSSRMRDEAGAYAPLLERIMGEEGLELRQLRVKYPRDSFFAKGSRVALIVPQSLSHESAADDLHARQRKLRLCFELPRGSYATIMIKRLTSAYMNRHKPARRVSEDEA